MKSGKLVYLPLLLLVAILPAPFHAQTTSNPANLPQRDGSHDFDFLIGNWNSGVGREYGRYGIEAFLEPKAILE